MKNFANTLPYVSNPIEEFSDFKFVNLEKDRVEILSKDFIIEKVYHDFGNEKKQKSLFVQYLARRK
ncbi:Uncharacterised protein [uncultured archaeon]|nr:Uncharacterised protein [uncultured archaeon]